MLEVNKIDVSYGDVQVLWEVSIKVSKSEVVAVIGSNGAGKTTLLRTISGLIHPSRGIISFLGKRIETLPPHKIAEAGISQVLEGRRLFPQMSVRENLELGAYTKAAWNKKEETMEFVFNIFPILKEREKQLAGTLSGGEQQMLAIGRALMSRPKLLMLDEPSLGLAPKIVLELFNIIDRIRDEGVTILLVEQNVLQSLTISDRGYVMENGRIILEDDAERLLNNPMVKKAYLGI
ncbi:MAG: ABC transporter ATP-binding protein [Candidatus Bathyarchaeia archaeon]